MGFAIIDSILFVAPTHQQIAALRKELEKLDMVLTVTTMETVELDDEYAFIARGRPELVLKAMDIEDRLNEQHSTWTIGHRIFPCRESPVMQACPDGVYQL